MCGGTPARLRSAPIRAGLSPRVRGNRPVTARCCRSRGSIPACAGEPPPDSAAPPSGRVYPRVCGGTDFREPNFGFNGGLSPRVRGNRYPRTGRPGHKRSIPACAGEPMTPLTAAKAFWVYPRVCGGTTCLPVNANPDEGLSPRVRGNRRPCRSRRRPQGSIPACAGEPDRPTSTSPTTRVYPRVCGGTHSRPQSGPASSGLSPRVRGNPTSSP